MTAGASAGLWIDLNADIGEMADAAGIGIERALAGLVSSVNIACGGHAGDAHSMRRVLGWAVEHGLALGAHPSYPDRDGFGRRRVELPPGVLRDSVAEQVGRLDELARAAGVGLAYVKAHGALYHDLSEREDLARAVFEAVGDRALMVAAGSRALDWWRSWGGKVIGEGFVDRRYEADGRLRARTFDDALITDPAAAAQQALDIVRQGRVRAVDGSAVRVEAASLCVHADTPGAVEIAQEVRRVLLESGVGIRAAEAR